MGQTKVLVSIDNCVFKRAEQSEDGESVSLQFLASEVMTKGDSFIRLSVEQLDDLEAGNLKCSVSRKFYAKKLQGVLKADAKYNLQAGIGAFSPGGNQAYPTYKLIGLELAS